MKKQYNLELDSEDILYLNWKLQLSNNALLRMLAKKKYGEHFEEAFAKECDIVLDGFETDFEDIASKND